MNSKSKLKSKPIITKNTGVGSALLRVSKGHDVDAVIERLKSKNYKGLISIKKEKLNLKGCVIINPCEKHGVRIEFEKKYAYHYDFWNIDDFLFFSSDWPEFCTLSS